MAQALVEPPQAQLAVSAGRPCLVATLLAYLLSVQSRSTTITLILAGLLVAALGWWLWNWSDWGNDLYILTADGVIDTERKPLGISSKKTVTTFDKVQNVSYDISNPWATLLRYGTVILQTAGAQGRLDFPYVRHPDKVPGRNLSPPIRLPGRREPQAA